MTAVFDEGTQQKIDALCTEYGVAKLWLFGSHARGDHGSDSDYDFVYVMKPEHLGWNVYVFADELETVLNKKVDIVSYDYMKKDFRKRVEADMVQIYEAA
jgi:predicted nucleotidyltransferase